MANNLRIQDGAQKITCFKYGTWENTRTFSIAADEYANIKSDTVDSKAFAQCFNQQFKTLEKYYPCIPK